MTSISHFSLTGWSLTAATTMTILINSFVIRIGHHASQQLYFHYAHSCFISLCHGPTLWGERCSTRDYCTPNSLTCGRLSILAIKESWRHAEFRVSSVISISPFWSPRRYCPVHSLLLRYNSSDVWNLTLLATVYQCLLNRLFGMQFHVLGFFDILPQVVLPQSNFPPRISSSNSVSSCRARNTSSAYSKFQRRAFWMTRVITSITAMKSSGKELFCYIGATSNVAFCTLVNHAHPWSYWSTRCIGNVVDFKSC